MKANEVIAQMSTFWNIPSPINGVCEIPNTGRDDLAKLFSFLHFGTGVEIGTERGLYAETLCKANPDLNLWCVDPYLAYPDYREHTTQSKIDGFREEAQERLRPFSVRFLRANSDIAHNWFPNRALDFVYIDGNHALKYVINDLCNWVPKVRSGGIVAGHDYISRKNAEYNMHVPEAIHAYCQSYNIRPLYILGSKAIITGEVRDKPRSWFFIKD